RGGERGGGGPPPPARCPPPRTPPPRCAGATAGPAMAVARTRAAGRTRASLRVFMAFLCGSNKTTRSWLLPPACRLRHQMNVLLHPVEASVREKLRDVLTHDAFALRGVEEAIRDVGCRAEMQLGEPVPRLPAAQAALHHVRHVAPQAGMVGAASATCVPNQCSRNASRLRS